MKKSRFFLCSLSVFSTLLAASISAHESSLLDNCIECGENALTFMMGEENKRTRLDYLCIFALKEEAMTEKECQEIDKNSLKRSKEVQNTIKGFSKQDQKNIEQFLEQVDLPGMTGPFIKMSPFAIARFLKISAAICFPEGEVHTKYPQVVGKKTDSEETLARLLLQKMSDEALAERYVVIDQNQVVWGI
ncbi:MAG: hypothetical protein HKM07_03735 [Chlamydiae bacterium]|nr:hypothetical protein [Chlamydiota bacterium]